MSFLVLACVTWTAVIMGLVWICLVLVERASYSCDADRETERHGLFASEDDLAPVQRVQHFQHNFDGALALAMCDEDADFRIGTLHNSLPLSDVIIGEE